MYMHWSITVDCSITFQFTAKVKKNNSKGTNTKMLGINLEVLEILLPIQEAPSLQCISLSLK